MVLCEAPHMMCHVLALHPCGTSQHGALSHTLSAVVLQVMSDTRASHKDPTLLRTLNREANASRWMIVKCPCRDALSAVVTGNQAVLTHCLVIRQKGTSHFRGAAFVRTLSLLFRANVVKVCFELFLRSGPSASLLMIQTLPLDHIEHVLVHDAELGHLRDVSSANWAGPPGIQHLGDASGTKHVAVRTVCFSRGICEILAHRAEGHLGIALILPHVNCEGGIEAKTLGRHAFGLLWTGCGKSSSLLDALYGQKPMSFKGKTAKSDGRSPRLWLVKVPVLVNDLSRNLF
mmetsp:Transcript_26738/g.52499  ORF Transcript_26738/g.52499 Transcript_26738/m.52499 type:complete len:289 (+) Transcript_26738:1763-2629(+)